MDVPPPPPSSKTTTSEPIIPLTSPSQSLQQQPPAIISASYQPPDLDNLLLQHSLKVTSTINSVLSYLENVVSLLKELLKETRTAFSLPPTKAAFYPQDSKSLPKSPLPAHSDPPSSTGHPKKLVSLTYDPNSIAITVTNRAQYSWNWSRLTPAKIHLATLLRIKPPQVDLEKIVRLTSPYLTDRFLLLFHSSRIPKILFQRSSTLSRDGIFTQRHFKNGQISNLFQSSTRLQEPKKSTHLPATLPTRTLNPCLSLTPSLCPSESPQNLEGKTDSPIPADSSGINFANSNPSPLPSVPHIHLESQSNPNAIPPDTPPFLVATSPDNSVFPTVTLAQALSTVPSLYPICHIVKPSNTGSFLLVDATAPVPPPTNSQFTNPNSSPPPSANPSLTNPPSLPQPPLPTLTAPLPLPQLSSKHTPPVPNSSQTSTLPSDHSLNPNYSD